MPKQSDYKQFFQKKLQDYDVKSPADMDDETKKKFFNEIEQEWKGDDQKK